MNIFDNLGLFNITSKEVPTLSGNKKKYSFSFGGCLNPYGTFIVERGLKRGVSLLFSFVGYLAPDPAGDVDIDGLKVRCKCMQYDPELQKYFEDELHLRTGEHYGEEKTKKILKQLIAKMKVLAKEKNETCKKCEDAYTPDTIIQNADKRGNESLRSKFRNGR